MKKTKQLIFVYTENFENYENTFLSFDEVAEFLHRSINSVRSSISYQKKNKTQNLVLEDSNKKKHYILLEKELRNCKWYKEEKNNEKK